MHKRILILSLCLIALLTAFIITGQNRSVNKASKTKYKMAHGYAGDVIAGTSSSANYKLTSGTVAYSAPENEEVH